MISVELVSCPGFSWALVTPLLPLDREIVLKIAKNSFTVVIVDKGLCYVSEVRFYQEIMNGHDRS